MAEHFTIAQNRIQAAITTPNQEELWTSTLT
jgi:hypothetical protein